MTRAFLIRAALARMPSKEGLIPPVMQGDAHDVISTGQVIKLGGCQRSVFKPEVPLGK